MQLRIFLYLFLLTAIISCNINPEIKPYEINLIPKPNFIDKSPGVFIIDKNTSIIGNNSVLQEMTFLKELIDYKSNFEVQLLQSSEKELRENSISFSHKNLNSSEAYELNINEKTIQIYASSSIGFIYAIQTLRQLLPPNFNGDDRRLEKQWSLPCLKIMDEPQFKWRGMLLDCCRHFMPKEFVLKYVDLLSYHKMNTLHWHLTEDQGWRIEIKKYPKLTEKGAWRMGEDGNDYGGFYTQEEIREVVAYAKKRGINIVPEIEMPGHSVAAISSYPELSCTGEHIPVETEWGVFKDIYCAGNDNTLRFLKDVMDEVIELFPGEYIHIGGDEAPKYRWENCSKCQKRIKDEGLHDEHELQSWFIQEIEKYLASKGKKLIGWDEILEGGLAEGAMVQSWRGIQGGIEAANQGHDVVMSPTSHCYFDYGLSSIDLEKVYSFYPVPAELSQTNRHHILGAECNMWSERAPYELVDSKVFPRILAMSEVLWTDSTGRDFNEFYNRVQEHYPRLSALGVDYGLETDPISYKTRYKDNLQLLFNKGIPDLDIYYSSTDSTPTPNDFKFDEFITITESQNLFAQAFKNGKSYGEPISVRVEQHKLNGSIPDYKFEWSPYYTGGGEIALSNGLVGTLDFRDGNWQAVQYEDVELIFDLNGKDINSVESHFYQYNNSWIFLPKWVEYSISLDGENWKVLSHLKHDRALKESGKFIQTFKAEFDTHKGKYLKVKAKNVEYCPDWHEAAGSKAWLFIDEIIVR